jgi:hypothetical protein
VTWLPDDALMKRTDHGYYVFLAALVFIGFAAGLIVGAWFL